MAVASSCAIVAGCSLVTTWDGLTSGAGGSPDGGGGGGGSARDAGMDAPPDVVDASVCKPTGHYCGGDEVSGDAGTLYRCNGASAPSVLAHCSDGCEVVSGQDDVCKGTGSCVVGAFYCGGDKVTGDPTALYKCTSGSSGTLVQHCTNGCAVVAGSNDACE